MPDPGDREQVLRRYDLRRDLSHLENAVLFMTSRKSAANSGFHKFASREQYLVFTKEAALWCVLAVNAAQTDYKVEDVVAGVVGEFKSRLILIEKLSEASNLDLSDKYVTLYLDMLARYSSFPAYQTMAPDLLFAEARESVSRAMSSLEEKGLIVDPPYSRKFMITLVMGLLPMNFSYTTQKGQHYVVKYSAALADIEYTNQAEGTQFHVDVRIQKILAGITEGMTMEKQRATRRKESD